jgi:mRNA interferase MazF
MKRGEIWTVADGTGYTGKPRPAVIVQDDRFDATLSILVCGFTTDPTDVPHLRVRVAPTPENGLNQLSHVMVDKLSAVRRTSVGTFVGALNEEDLRQLNQAIIVVLGLASVVDD